MHNTALQTLQCLITDTESRIPDRESRIPDRESRIPDRESRIPDRESRIPTPIIWHYRLMVGGYVLFISYQK